MYNDVPPGGTAAPARPTVRINAASALMIERLQAHHHATFGSKLSRPAVIQRALETHILHTCPPAQSPVPPGPPANP